MVTSFNTVASGTKGGSNTGLIIFGVVAAAALGYYFLVYKPEQDAKLAKNG